MFLIRTISIALPMHRGEAVSLVKELTAEVQKELGHPPARILTGSIGVSDSAVIMETEYESLAGFEEDLASLNRWDGMARYGARFAEIFAPGGNRFQVYRIQ